MTIRVAYDEDQTPLLEALDAIPHDAFTLVTAMHKQEEMHNYGQLCLRAAERIRLLEASLRERGITL